MDGKRVWEKLIKYFLMEWLWTCLMCLFLFNLFCSSFVDKLFYLDGLNCDCSIVVVVTDNAGTNKAASSSTSLNTKRLDDDTENLAREYYNI